jgi:very-short-patch-repair endonuclease
MPSIKEIVRLLRRNQTPEEKLLWAFLRDRKFNGKKFRRQYPIIYTERQYKKHFFVADFYCVEAKLIVELDGKVHDFQKEYDIQRDLIIKEFKLKVLRIKNDELKEPELVFKKIMEAM